MEHIKTYEKFLGLFNNDKDSNKVTCDACNYYAIKTVSNLPTSNMNAFIYPNDRKDGEGIPSGVVVCKSNGTFLLKMDDHNKNVKSIEDALQYLTKLDNKFPSIVKRPKK